MKWQPDEHQFSGSDAFQADASEYALKEYVGISEDYREGVILVDVRGRILSINRAACEIIEGGGLTAEGGVLRAGGAAETIALHLAIASAADDGLQARHKYAVVSREQRPALSLLVRSVQTAHRDQDAPATVAIFVADPERTPAPTLQQLQCQFGLTVTEARVAIELLSRDGVAAIAGELGTSVGTVKTHLRRIFGKTGVRRQSDLVRLLFSISHVARPIE